MADRTFQSPDGRFAVAIPEEELRKAVLYCSRAGRCETGGILVGRYSSDHACAVVTSASQAPHDSQAGRTWFSRGVDGLQKWLNGLWKASSYYLGEWHFHPFESASPSGDDLAEMGSIATSEAYHCPEPILMIIGGNPDDSWHVRVFVYAAAVGLLELIEPVG